jgi:hypothetical protein
MKKPAKRLRTGMEEKWEVVRHIDTILKAPKIPEDVRIGIALIKVWILDERTRRIKRK